MTIQSNFAQKYPFHFHAQDQFCSCVIHLYTYTLSVSEMTKHYPRPKINIYFRLSRHVRLNYIIYMCKCACRYVSAIRHHLGNHNPETFWEATSVYSVHIIWTKSLRCTHYINHRCPVQSIQPLSFKRKLEHWAFGGF